MRLRLSDTAWRWMRLTDAYAPLLRLSEVKSIYAVLFRPFEDVEAADLVQGYFTYFTEDFDPVTSDYIGYRFSIGGRSTVSFAERLFFTWDYRFLDAAPSTDKAAFFMVPPPVQESHAPSDKISTTVVSQARSAAASGDFTFGNFSCAVNSLAAAGSTQIFGITVLTRSSAANVDKITCTFQAGVRDSSSSTDRVFSTVVVLVKDAVTASSSFLLGGRSFLDTVSAGFSSDAFYSTLVAKNPESAVTSDSVEIGIRYLIEFYFGGLAIGGSPFGGRL